MKKRLFAAIMAMSLALSAFPHAFAVNDGEPEEINNTYDDVVVDEACDSAKDSFTLNESGGPNNGAYLKTGSSSAFIEGLEADSGDYYMWEADVCFKDTADLNGICIVSGGNAQGTWIVRRGSYIGTMQDSSRVRSVPFEIDSDAWYHVQLIGRHDSGSYYQQIMKVSKWDGGSLIWVGETNDVWARNTKVSKLRVDANTCIANVKIVKLGADTLTLSTTTDVTEISSGNGVQINLAATRNGRDIDTPDVEWTVLDEDDNEITDGSVTVDENGAVTTAASCPGKNIKIQARSTEKGNVTGTYPLTIKKVDYSTIPYRHLSISSDSASIKAGGEPVELTVSATDENDAPVELRDGDYEIVIYDEKNNIAINNKYITVNNDTLTVTNRVISQKITVRAQDENGVITAALPITITAAEDDVVDIGGIGDGDKILFTDPCEDSTVTGLQSGSWDGSHVYYVQQATDIGNIGSTTDDLIIEADIKFVGEDSGLSFVGDRGSGGAIQRQGDKIGSVSSGNKFKGIWGDADAESWYHIQIMTRCGTTGYYERAWVSKYNEDGSLGEATAGTLDLRQLYGTPFNHLSINAGTQVDNVRIMRLMPDKIELSLSTNEIFAGAKVQASCTVSRKGVEIPDYPASKLSWLLLDESGAILNDELIKIDSSGTITVDGTASEQTIQVYVRSTELGEDKADKKSLTIKGNDMFEVIAFGLNEDGTAITELKIDKKFFYNGDVVFIVAMYDENGTLMKVANRTYRDNTLQVGENNISIDAIEIPQDFGSVKAMIWTSL